MRDKWSSRSTFIIAAVGSAVGLGNAWRFPGLAAKYGGGAFLFVYILALIVIGIPLLMLEISVARHTKQGAPGSMRALHKKGEGIGWMGVTNALGISSYYAVVFAWVILMFFMSFKFRGMTGDTKAASNLWMETIKTTGTTSGFTTIAWPVFGCLLLAWGLCYICIRNGTTSVGKVVKFTVFLPVICLVVMAVRGISMPGALEGVRRLFVPRWQALSDSNLWIDAIGQVFYSLSAACAVMFAYGSFLDEKTNIAVDASIIAISDMLISILAGIVMFSTMAGTGMLDNMSTSGISTAFIIYPQAIVKLSDSGNLNMIFAFLFYFCLITLAIDSLFSMIEGASTAISDKFHLNKKKTTLVLCVIEGCISMIFITGAGLAMVDILDYFINSFMVILVGIGELIVAGWFFKTSEILDQINRNTVHFKVHRNWFIPAIRFIAPASLIGLFVWNIISLIRAGGIYGKENGYSLASNIVIGWLTIVVFLLSGQIVKWIISAKKKKGFVEDDIVWKDSDN